MKKTSIVLAVFTIFAGLAAMAGAQCLDRIGDWGFGPTESADGNGNIAVYGSGRVLQIARVTDPANPTLEASLGMPGLVSRVQVEGAWVFAAAAEAGFVVVDISSPGHPEIAATVATENSVRGIAVVGDLAYIGDGIEGLIILDVSDPTAPERLSVLALEGNAEDIVVQGPLVFLAENRTGLRIVDVADPSNPVSVAVIEDLDHSRRIAVTEDGMTAYLTNYFEGFHVIDVSDHLAPEIVGFVENPSYTIDLETDGSYLYAANRGYGMRIFDLADPRAPAEVRQVDEDGENQSVNIDGDLAILGNYSAGLRLVDVSSPSEAEEVGHLDGTPESKGAAVQGGLSYVSGGGQQVILDLSRPNQPVQTSISDFYGYTKRAEIDGRYVYASGDYRGIRVIDINDPAEPEEVGFVEPCDTYDVITNGDLLYVSCYDEGIRVIDISVPTEPVTIGALEGFRSGFIAHAGGVVYAPDYNIGVHMVDVSDPTNPEEFGMLEISNPIGRPEINGDLLFIADSNDGVYVFDAANPAAPAELATIPGARYGFGMAAMGDLLFVATIFNGAFLYDVSNPAEPVEVDTAPLATGAEGEVKSEGNLAVVAEQEGGIEIFDLGACHDVSPAADFTWRPVAPEAGSSVVLTDTSIGSVDTRQWNFGDGGTSGQRNPTHVWAEAGDYDVTLTVSGSEGSQTVTKTVTVIPRTGGPPITDPGEYSYVIAASAHASGLAGTQWVTDAVLHAPGTQPAQVCLWFMKAGQSNLGAEGVEASVAAGAALLIEDIVDSLFGEDEAAGAILIGSDQPLLVTSRTYNDAESGTFGQFIPGRDTAEAVAQAEIVHLIQLTRSNEFRANLGVANPTGGTISVDVTLRNAQGGEITTRTLSVPPYGYLQRTDILGTDAQDAFAVVSSSSPGASYFPFASVVDNRTGDPMLVEPIPADDRVVVAAAAHVGGFENTDWKTDLEVCNHTGAAVDARIDLLKSDQNNSSPSSSTVTIGGGRCDRLLDVLETEFAYEGSAALEVVAATGELMVSSRTFNSTDSGTYGQCLPGFPEADVIAGGSEGRMLQLAQSTGSNSGFRTNMGYVNRESTSITVEADLYFGTGTHLGTVTVTLRPYEHRQINRIFREVTSGAVTNGFAVVRSTGTGGSFVAYASVVDNASGDPVYIPAVAGAD